MNALESSVDTVPLSPDQARRLIEAFLRPAPGASLAARALVESELMGEPRFGFTQLDSLHQVGTQPPVVERLGPSRSRIDAAGVFGPLAVASAVEHSAELVAATGLALTTVAELAGLGRLASYAEWGAEQGYISIIAVDAPPAVAPESGVEPVLGTNPIAYAIPGSPALVADFATSEHTEAEADDSGVIGPLQPRGGLIGTLSALLVEALTGAVEGRWPDRSGRTATVIMIEPRDPGSSAGVVDKLEWVFLQAGARLPGTRRRQRLQGSLVVEMPETLHRVLSGAEMPGPDAGGRRNRRGRQP